METGDGVRHQGKIVLSGVKNTLFSAEKQTGVGFVPAMAYISP
jgi:hypothetical protein